MNLLSVASTLAGLILFMLEPRVVLFFYNEGLGPGCRRGSVAHTYQERDRQAFVGASSRWNVYDGFVMAGATQGTEAAVKSRRFWSCCAPPTFCLGECLRR